MRMPELWVPDLSRRQAIALAAVVAGLVVIALALFAGSDSSDGATNGSGSDTNQVIEPVEPINPDDPDARTPEDLKDSVNPLSPLADPFATSFGGNFKHKITVRLSSDSILKYGIRFRDGFEAEKIVNGGATFTRTVRGGYPLVQVGMRIGPKNAYGTCSVTIDGVKVSSHTIRKGLGVVVCTG